MSKYLNKIIVMLMTCCLVMNNNLVLCAHSYKTKEVLATSSNLKMDTIDEEEQIIYDCISYINDKNIDAYISLFTEDNVKMMQDFIENGREEEFFKEEKVELKGLTKLSEKTGQLSAAVTDKEKEEYDEICVYYAEEDIQYKEGNQIEDDFLQDSGRNFLVYVLGKKNDNYKILRISTPVVEIITASNEGFSTTSEAEFEQKQIEKSTVSDLSKIETLDNVSNDDTRDQDFQYNYYSTICSTDTYKTYCKEAYAYAKARLMVVKSTEKIFETHYNANGGGYHSGILSQNGILTLAKEGYTCGKMLKYYYDNSEYTGNKEITLISAD